MLYLYLLTYARMMEIQPSRTNFATEQNVGLIEVTRVATATVVVMSL